MTNEEFCDDYVLLHVSSDPQRNKFYTSMRGDLAYHVQALHELVNANNEVFEVFSLAMELQKFDYVGMLPVKDRSLFRMFANVKSGRIMCKMKGDIVTIALLLARFMKQHNAVLDMWTLFVKSSFINTLHQN